MDRLPHSIAIAGSEGFMGQNIVKAALGLDIEDIILSDPRIDPGRYAGLRNVRSVVPHHFNDIDAGLFHFATHPGQRSPMYRLIERGCHINVEKPMVHPENPMEAEAIFDALEASNATLLYDFLEMFNPRTLAIVEMLKNMGDAQLDHITFIRGKNRENLWNPRNESPMLPIEYQETVHCMAYLVNLFANQQGVYDINFESVFPKGFTVWAKSRRYDAPNPEKYPYVVDGYCAGTIDIGECTVDFLTNFKRGAEKTKRKIMLGHNAYHSIDIEVNDQLGQEYLRINGAEHQPKGEQDQYKSVILGSWQMHQEMMQGKRAVRPDARFAWLAFGLCGAIFMSSYLQTEVALRNQDDFNEAARFFNENAPSYKRGKYKAKSWYALAKQYTIDWLDTEGRKDTMPKATG